MKKPIAHGNTIKIPSSQDYLADVDNFVEGFLKRHEVNPSQIADIAISVTEMVINSIVHGNGSNPEKAVTIVVNMEDSTVKIVVSDEGLGFDPSGVESPIAEKNLLKEVGRGIFITKSLMDSVDFESLPGGGTQVILKKQI